MHNYLSGLYEDPSGHLKQAPLLHNGYYVGQWQDLVASYHIVFIPLESGGHSQIFCAFSFLGDKHWAFYILKCLSWFKDRDVVKFPRKEKLRFFQQENTLSF